MPLKRDNTQTKLSKTDHLHNGYIKRYKVHESRSQIINHVDCLSDKDLATHDRGICNRHLVT